jgi:hypothetical protein
VLAGDADHAAIWQPGAALPRPGERPHRAGSPRSPSVGRGSLWPWIIDSQNGTAIRSGFAVPNRACRSRSSCSRVMFMQIEIFGMWSIVPGKAARRR